MWTAVLDLVVWAAVLDLVVWAAVLDLVVWTAVLDLVVWAAVLDLVVWTEVCYQFKTDERKETFSLLCLSKNSENGKYSLFVLVFVAGVLLGRQGSVFSMHVLSYTFLWRSKNICMHHMFIQKLNTTRGIKSK